MFDHADAALAWSVNSPSTDREERGLAISRAMHFQSLGMDSELLLMVLEEFAGEGHPAMWFTEQVARERIERLQAIRSEAAQEHAHIRRMTA